MCPSTPYAIVKWFHHGPIYTLYHCEVRPPWAHLHLIPLWSETSMCPSTSYTIVKWDLHGSIYIIYHCEVRPQWAHLHHMPLWSETSMGPSTLYTIVKWDLHGSIYIIYHCEVRPPWVHLHHIPLWSETSMGPSTSYTFVKWDLHGPIYIIYHCKSFMGRQPTSYTIMKSVLHLYHWPIYITYHCESFMGRRPTLYAINIVKWSLYGPIYIRVEPIKCHMRQCKSIVSLIHPFCNINFPWSLVWRLFNTFASCFDIVLLVFPYLSTFSRRVRSDSISGSIQWCLRTNVLDTLTWKSSKILKSAKGCKICTSFVVNSSTRSMAVTANSKQFHHAHVCQ